MRLVSRSTSLNNLRKHHLARIGLQTTDDFYTLYLPDKFLRLFNHHHRAIAQMPNCLVRILPFLRQFKLQRIARQMRHAQTFCQLIDIEHHDAFHLRNFIEIIINRQHRRIHLLGELEQSRVDTLRDALLIRQ